MNQLRMYIRLHHRIKMGAGQPVYLRDIAQYILPDQVREQVLGTPIMTITESDGRLVMIDILKIIRFVNTRVPEMEVESLGENQTIIEISSATKRPSFLLVAFVWLLLFCGSGLAIMHFHEDVNMLVAHQKVYYLMTAKEVEHPLLLQIPYSIGIGLGMMLFFNRIFRKRFNPEPSPLEVEMFNYQQNLDEYTVMHKQVTQNEQRDEH